MTRTHLQLASPPGDRVLYGMRALGRSELPEAFALGGVGYSRVRTVKHDFFAATGFYRSDAGTLVVLKIGRTAPFAGVPMEWLGRWLRSREVRFYRALADLPNVPALLGVTGPTGFVHACVTGQPLRKGLAVPDGYFPALFRLLDEVHRRGIAYVDTNKCPNLLLGEDGEPYFIDFQISFDLRGPLGRSWPARWWLARLQREDRYHLLKQKRRLRPDQLTPAEREAAGRRSLLIRAHRTATRPYFLVRRWLFKRLRDGGRLLPEGSA